jgi:hypothetical protein
MQHPNTPRDWWERVPREHWQDRVTRQQPVISAHTPATVAGYVQAMDYIRLDWMRRSQLGQREVRCL